jgi:hypothetical protein
MAGQATKILLLILFIHIFLYIGVEETRGQVQPYIQDIAHISISTNTSTNLTSVGILNQTMTDYDISSGDSVASGTGIYMYNPFSAVWGFFMFLWGIITSPLALLTLDIHWVIKLIFIAPLGFAYLLALIGFLRGNDL